MSDGIDITLSWESPLPIDDLQSVQACVLLKGIGVSNATIQRKLGYDPEEEARLSAEEDALAMKNNPLLQQDILPQAIPGVTPLPGQPPAVAPGQQSTLQGGGQQ